MHVQEDLVWLEVGSKEVVFEIGKVYDKTRL
jgi:hypothetical protein